MSISPLALAAKKVIDAAWLNGSPYDLASQAAFALESAQLLQSPETAAEIVRLQSRVIALEAAATTHYRAGHPDSGIVLGTYSNRGEAKLHCEASARRDPALSTAIFSWIDDEEDGVCELVAELVRDAESTTGYVVTEIEVASEYDAEADE